MTEQEIIDLISEAISDSLEMDWTPRDGARSVYQALNEEGLLVIVEREQNK